jgi:hypothetical protein
MMRRVTGSNFAHQLYSMFAATLLIESGNCPIWRSWRAIPELSSKSKSTTYEAYEAGAPSSTSTSATMMNRPRPIRTGPCLSCLACYLDRERAELSPKLSPEFMG